MNCALGATGLDGLLLLLVGLAAIGLILGGTLLVARHRRAGIGVALLLLVALGVGVGTIAPPPASAACPTPSPTVANVNSLTIIQLAVLNDLSPTTAPILIHGTITNNSDEPGLIDDIDVSITGVTLAVGAPAGECDASDYELVGAQMPVNVTLAPHATTTFSGATIAFVDEPWNQDACQGATVLLGYVID